MKITRNISRLLTIIIFAVLSLSVIGLVYSGSLPVRYALSVGVVSTRDIIAPRAVIDKTETQSRAEESRNSVAPVYVRSETISAKGSADITEFFSLCNQIRNDNVNENGTVKETYTAVSNNLIGQVQSTFGFTLTNDEAFQLITSDSSLLDYIQSQTASDASLILKDKVDDAGLKARISELSSQVTETGTNLYVSSKSLVQALLTNLLKPNAVYDETATNAARQSAYNAAINDPVMIEKGSRIVSYGDVITDASYQTLKDLDLIETNDFDYTLLLGIAVYVLFLLTVLVIYVKRFESELMKNFRDLSALLLCFIVPILCSVYLSDFSNLITPVFFTAVISATYLGAQSGILVSILQMLIILPIYNFDIQFVFVSIAGIFVSSMIAGQRSRKYNSASLILLTALTCSASALAINLVMKSSRTDAFVSIVWAIIAGSVSVIAAIGFMPIFELISNTVSPVRLIDLSQPGNPLLKRLFVEAPGTSQHSMMVANLADSAAEAIGANALLAKVGAYYHDIGKLEKPQFFTENQQDGKNPHDLLPPEESAAIITAHPDQGVRLARRYRLPAPIVRIIQEHHGSTFQAYFYHKAKTTAAEKGLPEPPMSNFRYRCSIPTSRESAVVMLADTCEAAIKSTGITSLDAAEELFRKLIKQKIDQDQLIYSGLSFNDVELIIRSFLQVYAGFFHERVKYPDDSPVRK